jgi:hypothetical protein
VLLILCLQSPIAQDAYAQGSLEEIQKVHATRSAEQAMAVKDYRQAAEMAEYRFERWKSKSG